MKNLKRMLVICVSLCMILTSMGAMGPAVSKAYADTDYTDINFDFNYNKSSTQALNDSVNFQGGTVPLNYNTSSENKFIWKHPEYGDGYADLKEFMQSKKDEDKYISLCHDIEPWFGKTHPDPIRITEDKVLDLNGHTIFVHDDSNKANGDYNFDQSSNPSMHRNILFEIEDGATLTIIDSSERYGHKGTGGIRVDGRLLDPFDEGVIRYYTTRDLFWVNNGNLVIYGGTYQAGHQKGQKKGITWDDVKNVIGEAVELGINVASYAVGIDLATASYDDLKDKVANGLGDDMDSKSEDSFTKKKTGEGSVKDEKVSSPNEKASDDGKSGRDKTIGEKKDASEKNDSNEDGTGKYDKNTKLAEGRKKIVDAASDKTGLENIINGVFAVGEGIAKMFGYNEETKIIQVIHGTCVHVGSQGTFVCYGGTFKGYGSTPNTKNAVVEVVRSGDKINDRGVYPGGLAYIYGGTFEGNAGANVFNLVRTNQVSQKRLQTNVGSDVNDKENQEVELSMSETYGLEELKYEENGDPIDTRNIMVRQGVFRNYYEYRMLAIQDNEDSSDHFKKFIGTPGSVNLGITSFGKDMIRDGRIQITDNYGDGALVLLDEHKNTIDEVYHYRLFCGDVELREKTYLTVGPNTPGTSTFYSLRLKTTYENGEEDESDSWESTGENVREGAFSMTEKVFSYPLNYKTTKGYYVTPYLPNTNVNGTNMDTSDTWFYKTPINQSKEKIDNFLYGDTKLTIPAETPGYVDRRFQHAMRDKDWKEFAKKGGNNAVAAAFTQNYKANLKWFTYKVYRVDPLTRENISEDYTFGSDVPLLRAEYGANTDGIKGRIALWKLEEQIKAKNTWFKGFKSGDMYRIVLEVSEYLNWDYDVMTRKYAGELKPAVSKTSIVFRCYNIDELKDVGEETLVEDFTPLQWTNYPGPGHTAHVKLTNAMAGKVDFEYNKIFDVYYQWYVKNDNGPDTLIAGTTNIYKGSIARKRYHAPAYWKVGSDGYEYKNTIDPKDPNISKLDENTGLPKNQVDWTAEQIHMYTHEMLFDTDTLKLDPSKQLTLQNNRRDATSSDSCYIPEELNGKTIYCKATVVNLRWRQDYDYVQVFYSKPIQVPKLIVPLKATMKAEYSGEYITKDNPLKMSITEVKGLKEGEYITKVVYDAFGWGCYVEDLKATKASEIPAKEFPKDFYPEGYDLSKIEARHEYKTSVYIFTNKDRWKQIDSGLPPLNYEVEVTGVDFDRENDVIELDKDTENPEKLLKAYTKPENASIGWLYIQGDTFTASDPKVATLNDKGELVMGGVTGSSTITLKSPDGKNRAITIKATDRIEDLDVSGIQPPKVGQTLDTSAEVPSDAPYTVEDVYWTIGKSTEPLSKSATCQDLTVYNVNVVIKADPGYTFLREVPFRLVIEEADGSMLNITDKANHLKFEDNTKLDKLTLSYRYEALVGGSNPTINKVFVDFPEVVNEGDNLDDWEDQVKVYGATGDKKFDTIIRETKGADASDIVKALGYDSVRTFIKGVQTGPEVRIFIPDDSSQVFTDDVQVYLNGELGKPEYIERYSDDNKTITVTGYDTLTVLEGNAGFPEIPKYRVKDFNIGKGDKIYLDDLLEGDTSGVELTVDMERGAIYNSGYFGYNEEENYIEGKKASTDTVPIYLVARIGADASGRGGMRQVHKVEKKIESSPQSQPSNAPVSATYRIFADGKTITGNVTTEAGYISIPETEGKFYTTVSDSNVNYYDVTLGPDRIYVGNIPSGVSFNLSTVNAEDTALYAGKDQITVNTDAEGLLISVDRVHWTAGARITGLKPDTQYMVYFKQGVNGTEYSKAVKTAKTEPALYVGKVPVTADTPGNLEKYGWEYDFDNKVLTLKYISLYTSGLRSDLGNYWGGAWTKEAGITANEDLTIRLIGSNEIICDSEGTLANYGIYCNGNLTLEGNGDLILTMQNNILAFPIECTGDLNLKSTGLIEIDGAPVGFSFSGSGGRVNYYNGDVEYNGFTASGIAVGKLIHKGVEFNFTNKVHDLTIKADADGGRIIGTDDFAAESAKDNFIVSITANHNSSMEVESAECHVSGDCESGAEYYKSCSCGHIDYDQTFTTPQGSHSYKTYPGQAANCYKDGWKEYKVCEKCGKSTFEAIKSPGHKWVHHDEITPTCTQDGYPGYDVCSVCGFSTEQAVLNTYGEGAWKATGHHVHFVAGKAATCKEAGYKESFKCDDCGKLFKDEDALEPLTEAEIKLPAQGHKWDNGTVTKVATETEDGEIVYTCQLCGETRKIVIAKGSGEGDIPGPPGPEDPDKTSITGGAIAPLANYTYSGKAFEPSVTLTVGGKTLTAGTDYTVAYENNVNAGTAKVIVTGIGAYTGTLETTFTIKVKAIKPKIVLSKTSLVYNGKVQKPKVTVKFGTKKISSSNYKLKWAKGRKNVGRYSLKVTMKKNYSGTKTVYFNIVPKAAAIGKVTGVKKGVKVTWKAVKTKMSKARITGYEIQTATNKAFTKNVKNTRVKGYKKTSGSVKGLKSKKTYYVRVRTYMKVGKKVINSKWSKVKTVKVK